jgi:hypothetical protein
MKMKFRKIIRKGVFCLYIGILFSLPRISSAEKHSIRATGSSWAYRHLLGGFDNDQFQLGVWGDGENDLDLKSGVPSESHQFSYAYIKWKLPESLKTINSLDQAKVVLKVWPLDSLKEETLRSAPLRAYAIPTFEPGKVETAQRPNQENFLGESTPCDVTPDAPIVIKVMFPQKIICDNGEIAIVLTSKILAAENRSCYYPLASTREEEQFRPLLELEVD